MFTVLIVQPIFNLLVLIYALLPGHNFGVAIILFTILVRMMLLPLVKKQLHQSKAIRALQPEIKKIKAATKGDRQKESKMLMELYREKNINPFSSIGIILVQLPILLGLYYALKRLIEDPGEIVKFSYGFIENLSWVQSVGANISKFDNTLLGLVDLSRKAIEPAGIYWPAMLLVIGGAVAQFIQSRQLMPKDKDARGLRQILKEAGKGNQAEQSEVNAAVGRMMIYLIPLLVFVFSLNFEAGLPLYWFVAAVVAIIQQSIILKEDQTEMEGIVGRASQTGGDNTGIVEAKEEAVSRAVDKTVKQKAKRHKKSSKKAKRRRK